MSASISNIRLLIRHLREVMVESIDAQSRLDKIVQLISNGMGSQVCSVYVIQDDGTLELYATVGLKKSAVHLTKLNRGEGLVGLVAEKKEPFAVQNAQLHPAFSFKPETGEELFFSFLGIPLLRAGALIGVLVLQDIEQRIYNDDEIEAMQTVAMVLAEMLTSSTELQSLAPRGTKIGLERPLSYKGVCLSPGIGMGYAVFHEPRIIVHNLVAINPEAEVERLLSAIAEVRTYLDRLLSADNKDFPQENGEYLEVLETFRIFVHDPGWLKRLREAVYSGLTAEAAIGRVQEDFRARLSRHNDPYWRDRLHDLDDLAHRLLHHLMGHDLEQFRGSLPDNAIIIARSLGPAALLDYDRKKIKGLVLEEGGVTSHVAVVARALRIPVVSEIPQIISSIEAGQAIIVDGLTGDVLIRPKADVQTSYSKKVRLLASRRKHYRAQKNLPCETRDGIRISLHLNVGLPMDFSHIKETGAEGIGLFRTELQFLIAEQLPSTSQQEELYQQAYQDVGKKPILFRTLDVGGDKVIPYMPLENEENPALGWRAIRIGLDRPGLLRAQIRALFRSAEHKPLYILFPMIASLQEFHQAKAIVEKEKTYFKAHGKSPPKKIKLGVMLEVPSLLFQLDDLCAEVDFISIGSNDLLQFLFAADRDNKKVSQRYDSLSLTALRVFRKIIQETTRYNIPVSVCGEMAGRPIEALVLAALGFRSLSMSSPAIGPVKAAFRQIHLKDIEEIVENVLDTGTDNLRQRIMDLCIEREILL